MTFVQSATSLGERLPLPDVLTKAAIDWLVGRTRQKLSGMTAAAHVRSFAEDMSRHPIAIHTDEVNSQHYEVPAEFFNLMLGPQRKYSCCYYEHGARSLTEAEEHALAETAQHAGLADGQRILELGCGWGSLSLWMARRYPAARIVSVSNSRSQRAFITSQAEGLGISNLDVVTADMNVFTPSGDFDRVVSVEMFEHMANWIPLLERIRGCLTADGRLFVHVFSHRNAPYRFDHDDKDDWIAQHFFTGGIMPSHDLIRQFPQYFEVEQEWRWNGLNYRRTAEDWLANYDRNADAISDVLDRTYGADAALWQRRWRLFLLATMGLFGHANGEEWGVSHYRLAPA